MGIALTFTIRENIMTHYKDPDTGKVFAYETADDCEQWGPPGLIPLTDAEVAALSGSPPFSEVRAIELDLFRVSRERYLNRLSGIGLAAVIAGDTATAQAAATLRQGLLDLPAHPTVEAATELRGLQDAMKAVYAALIVSVPASVRDEFKKVDQ